MSTSLSTAPSQGPGAGWALHVGRERGFKQCQKWRSTMENKIWACGIGAGPSGIAAAKNAIRFCLDAVVFEKHDNVGGNWAFNADTGHSSAYENTHTINSKTWSEYEDCPMPDHY